MTTTSTTARPASVRSALDSAMPAAAMHVDTTFDAIERDLRSARH